MNKALLILSAASAMFLMSCDKESAGTINDFSNNLPAYVNLTGAPDTLDFAPGDAVNFAVTMRNAIQRDVTVSYNVSQPVNLSDQSLVITRNALKAVGSFDIPANILPNPSDTVYATMTLTKAVTADGQGLTLGRYNDSTDQHIVCRIANAP